jgi:hypothetical protein
MANKVPWFCTREHGMTEEKVIELVRRVNLMNFYHGPYRLFS